MSDTTTVNSRAMQALLAHSESQPKTGTQGPGSSFHQMLEGALTERAQAVSSPASLAKAAVPGDSPLGSTAAKLTKALGNASALRRPDAAKQLAPRGVKPAANAGAAADDLDPAAGPTGTSAAKADAKPAASPTDAASPKLDANQLQIVNAPALPEQAAAAVRASPQLAQARAQGAAAPKPNATPAAQQAGASAAEAMSASAGAPRGFASVLASAHVSSTLPTALVDQANFDPTLQMTVTPQAAHLSMDTGATGPLIAQLQITNGVADVRLTGDAASVLARHGAELSLGLTAAGLQPGRVEITAPTAASDMQSATSDGGGRSDARAQGDPDAQSGQGPRQPPKLEATTATLSQRASHVHVKA